MSIKIKDVDQVHVLVWLSKKLQKRIQGKTLLIRLPEFIVELINVSKPDKTKGSKRVG